MTHCLLNKSYIVEHFLKHALETFIATIHVYHMIRFQEVKGKKQFNVPKCHGLSGPNGKTFLVIFKDLIKRQFLWGVSGAISAGWWVK